MQNSHGKGKMRMNANIWIGKHHKLTKSRGELYKHHLDWQVMQVPVLLYTVSKDI